MGQNDYSFHFHEQCLWCALRMDPIVDGADGVGFQSAFARALAQASVRRSKHSQALQLAAPLPPDAAPDENINTQLKEVSFIFKVQRTRCVIW